MIVTLDNLRRGIAGWMSRAGWPSDLHAPLYPTLMALRSNGFTVEWWEVIVDHLWTWKAIRPQPKAGVRERGLGRLSMLAEATDAITRSSGAANPSLDTCDWKTVQPLFELASAIKGAPTPVFGSKLCHFILPDVFPVIDQDFIGLTSPSYQAYWQRCQAEWTSCVDRAPLLAEVAARIRVADAAAFPWTTKITELCIGGTKAV